MSSNNGYAHSYRWSNNRSSRKQARLAVDMSQRMEEIRLGRNRRSGKALNNECKDGDNAESLNNSCDAYYQPEMDVANDLPASEESENSAGSSVTSDESDSGNGFPSVEEILAALPQNRNSSKKEWLLLALTLICKHKAPRQQQQMIIDSMRLTGGKKHIPPTTYLFWKAIEDVAGIKPEAHFVCRSCREYMEGAAYPMKTREVACLHCGTVNSLNAGGDNGFWFFYIPLRSCLPDFLEGAGRQLDYPLTRTREEGVISDIYDGTLYKNLPLRHTGLQAPSPVVDVTLSLNIDGTPAFKSSSPGSIESMQVEVLELPPGLRAKNTLPIGSWFGRAKADGFSAQALLHPLVEELLLLQHDPIRWTHDGRPVQSCVYLHSVIVDSIARPDIIGLMSFHAPYGCHVCFHPGNRVPIADGSDITKQAYFYNDDHKLLRNRESFEHDWQRVQDGTDPREAHGVKLRSKLLELQYLDFPACVICEVMHASLEGEVKRIYTHHICQTKGKSETMTKIGESELRKIEKEFQRNRPGYPAGITRHLRSFRQLGYFKAAEFGLLAFFGHLAMFEDLPEAYLDHFASLSVALHVLHGERITKSDLQLAEELLEDYVSRHAELYGERESTFNMHQHLHFARTVRLAGPLSKANAFGFESTQKKLKTTIHGSNGPLIQVLHGLQAEFASASLWLAVRRSLNSADPRDEFLLTYVGAIRQGRSSSATMIGPPQHSPSEDIKNYVRLRIADSDSVSLYDRADFPGLHRLETSARWRDRLSKRTRNSKLASCFVIDESGKFFLLRSFFSVDNRPSSANAIVERIIPDEEEEALWTLSSYCNRLRRISCVGSTSASCLELLSLSKIRYHAVVVKHEINKYHLVCLPMVFGMW